MVSYEYFQNYYWQQQPEHTIDPIRFVYIEGLVWLLIAKAQVRANCNPIAKAQVGADCKSIAKAYFVKLRLGSNCIKELIYIY